MKIILPKKENKRKLKVGDVMKSKFSDIYILSQVPGNKYAWFNPFNGTCANGIFNTFDDLVNNSQRYVEDSGYDIYSADEYNLELVPKGV